MRNASASPLSCLQPSAYPHQVSESLIYEEPEGHYYLMTNWHVLSGLHAETQQPLDEHGAIPDRLEVVLHQATQLGAWWHGKIDLRDNQGRPIWFEHPTHRHKVDVVALEVEQDQGCAFFPINRVEFTKNLRVAVAQDVFIVGFPRGITGGGQLPIWKKGSIASEPNVNLDGLPKMLIDATTREGLSGAPVIVQYVGLHKNDPKSPTLASDDWIGMGRKFLGVYSGRIGLASDQFEAQLGIVWKAPVIEEVIRGQLRPD